MMQLEESRVLLASLAFNTLVARVLGSSSGVSPTNVARPRTSQDAEPHSAIFTHILPDHINLSRMLTALHLPRNLTGHNGGHATALR